MLKKLIAEEKTVFVPGVYDCVSARIVENLGFKAASITGYGLEASVLGNPDIGLATKTDVITYARYICRSVEIPVICDADTGYGNVLNVWEMVKEFEQVGISGIHMEDQELPKKCGGMSGRRLVPIEIMRGKIEAAVDARTDKDFLIIARSDARGVFGVDEAIKRFNAYIDAGADIVFAGEHYEVEELKQVVNSVKGYLCICGGIPGWEDSQLTLKDYQEIGIKMVLFPLVALYTATRAIFDIYNLLKTNNGISGAIIDSKMLGYDEFNELIGLSYWRNIENRYLKSCEKAV